MSGGSDVQAHLRDELTDTVEAPLVADLVEEIEADLLVVDVALEAEEKSLHSHMRGGLLPALEGRVVTDVDGGAIAGARHEDASGVHAATGKDRARLDVDVGGGHAQRTAALVAVDDHAGGRRRPAEDLAHLLELAVVQQPADAGGTDRSAVLGDELADGDVEAVCGAAGAQLGSVAGAAGPEVEVLADDDDPRLQSLRQQVGAELRRSERGEALVERKEDQLVRFQLADQPDLLLRRGQKPRHP